MEQPIVHIFDHHDTDFGERKIQSLDWNDDGVIVSFKVEMAGGLMTFYRDLPQEANIFLNANRNLYCKWK